MKGIDGSHLIIICELIGLAVLGIGWVFWKFWEAYQDEQIRRNCWK